MLTQKQNKSKFFSEFMSNRKKKRETFDNTFQNFIRKGRNGYSIDGP